MALSAQDQAGLKRILGAKFPQSDEWATNFLGRVDAAVLSYRLKASLAESMPSAEKAFRDQCRHAMTHTKALLRLLERRDPFARLIALEMFPTPLRRELNRLQQVQYVHERSQARKAAFADFRQAMARLNAATIRGADASNNLGGRRRRGRPAGLLDAQVELAVDCCYALELIEVTPRLTMPKRKGEGRAAEYPALLRWALSKADRRTKGERPVTGDVYGIARKGLQHFKKCK